MFQTDGVIVRLVKCIKGGFLYVIYILWLDMALLQYNYNYINP